MDMSKVPEPMRRRIEERERLPTIDKVRDFLGAFLFDAIDLDEARASMKRVSRTTTRRLKRDLTALDEFMDEPQPPGVLMRMVASDANWVLDDLSDEAAAAFLRQIADMLRDVIAQAEQR